METKTRNIRFALLSVSNKECIVDFAKSLYKLGFKILSTGGTAKVLAQHQIPVVDIASYTQEEESLSGRVKTIHPKIFSGILFDRENPQHTETIKAKEIKPIDIVVVNFYPFYKEAIKKNLPLEKAINFIDIGGPSLLRSAAKNWKNCLPVCHHKQYESVVHALEKDNITVSLRTSLAHKAFLEVTKYDAMISQFFSKTEESFPSSSVMMLDHKQVLKYGENPHQEAAFYSLKSTLKDQHQIIEVLNGGGLSYNNLLDLDSGVQMMRDLSSGASVVILKHTNPCGAAQGEGFCGEIFKRALASDPMSAFGGVVVCNFSIDQATASLMSTHFFECIAAPSFSTEALDLLKKKKKLRLVQLECLNKPSQDEPLSLKAIFAGVLVQQSKKAIEPLESWKNVTTKKVSVLQKEGLHFAMQVAKHVKSNAIVICQGRQVLGIGAGQMSRVDSAQIAIQKALATGHCLKESVVASDGFFPFKDCIELFAKHQISAVVQPGGSIRDQESVDACDQHQIAMLLSGNRHFKH